MAQSPGKQIAIGAVRCIRPRRGQERNFLMSNSRCVGRTPWVGMGLLLAVSTACTTSVSISTRVMHADKATYGSAWPFRSSVATAQCNSATGHAPQLSVTIGSATYPVDGPGGLGLPDNVFTPGGRQRFPSLYASLITGC